jgi:hypothetical protein
MGQFVFMFVFAEFYRGNLSKNFIGNSAETLRSNLWILKFSIFSLAFKLRYLDVKQKFKFNQRNGIPQDILFKFHLHVWFILFTRQINKKIPEKIVIEK